MNTNHKKGPKLKQGVPEKVATMHPIDRNLYDTVSYISTKLNNVLKIYQLY